MKKKIYAPMLNEEGKPNDRFIDALTKDINELMERQEEQVEAGTRLKSNRLDDYPLMAGISNKVPHGLGETPTIVTIVPNSDVRFWQTRKPDLDYIYVDVSAHATADITVVV